MSFTKYSSLHARMCFTAPPSTTKKTPGSSIWAVVPASGALTWPSEFRRAPCQDPGPLSNLTTPISKYPGGMHVGLDLNYIQPELLVSPSSPRRWPC